MRRISSAPGKVVLSGEYAVLEGAPAIAMAVDRRAVLETEFGTEGAAWETGGHDIALLETVIASLEIDGTIAGRCDTSGFVDTQSGRKYGLGSSAAVAVALAANLLNREDVLSEAMAAHRAWQGETGSGIDVACSLSGGLIEYRMAAAEIHSLTWPDELHARLIWVGEPSSTRAKLAKLGAAEKSASGLAEQSAQIARAWGRRDAQAVLDTYPAYIDALRVFDIDHGLGIFDAGHDELVDAAAAENLVYKPCGAGGGDVGVVLCDDIERADAFVASHDLYAIDCSLDPNGVRVE